MRTGAPREPGERGRRRIHRPRRRKASFTHEADNRPAQRDAVTAAWWSVAMPVQRMRRHAISKAPPIRRLFCRDASQRACESPGRFARSSPASSRATRYRTVRRRGPAASSCVYAVRSQHRAQARRSFPRVWRAPFRTAMAALGGSEPHAATVTESAPRLRALYLSRERVARHVPGAARANLHEVGKAHPPWCRSHVPGAAVATWTSDALFLREQSSESDCLSDDQCRARTPAAMLSRSGPANRSSR